MSRLIMQHRIDEYADFFSNLLEEMANVAQLKQQLYDAQHQVLYLSEEVKRFEAERDNALAEAAFLRSAMEANATLQVPVPAKLLAPAMPLSATCPDDLTPGGPECPRCGNARLPSGVGGGSWVHAARPVTRDVPDGMCSECLELRPCSCGNFCPSCLADIKKVGDDYVCVGCGRTLHARKGPT